ncbi:MAG: hypothetical protein ACO1SV_16455 [Fimbriimonas sp.]
MSYDLVLFRRVAGEAPAQTFERIVEAQGLDEEIPPPFDPRLALDLRAVADAFLASGIPLTESPPLDERGFRRPDDSIELSPAEANDPMPFQITVRTHNVDVSIPFWELTPDRERLLRERWGRLTHTMESLNLTGFDSQADAPIGPGLIDEVVAVVRSTGDSVRAWVAEKEVPKPWWRFW